MAINVIDNLTSTSATDALSANMGRQLKFEIDQITPNVATNAQNISINGSEIASVEARVTIVEASLTGFSSSLNSLDARVTILENEVHPDPINVIDNLNSTSATDALSANQGRILNNYRVQMEGDITQLQSDVIDNTNNITSLDLRVTTLENNFVSPTVINNTLISTAIDEALSANMGRVLKEKQDTIDTRLTTTEGETTSLDGRVTALESNVYNPTVVIDGFDSTDPEAALSANKGRELKEYDDAQDLIIESINQRVLDLENTPGGVQIIDNLTSTDPEAALSANMGRVLNEKISGGGGSLPTGTVITNSKNFTGGQDETWVDLEIDRTFTQAQAPNLFNLYYDPNQEIDIELRGGFAVGQSFSSKSEPNVYKVGNFWVTVDATTNATAYNSDGSQSAALAIDGDGFFAIYGATDKGIIVGSGADAIFISLDGNLTDVNDFVNSKSIAWTKTDYFADIFAFFPANSPTSDFHNYVICRENKSVIMLSGRKGAFAHIDTDLLFNASHDVLEWTVVDMSLFIDTTTYPNFINDFSNSANEYPNWGISPLGNVVLCKDSYPIIYTYNLNDNTNANYVFSSSLSSAYTSFSYCGDKLFLCRATTPNWNIFDADDITTGEVIHVNTSDTLGYFISKDRNDYMALGNSTLYPWDQANSSYQYISSNNMTWQQLRTKLNDLIHTSSTFCQTVPVDQMFCRFSAAMMHPYDFVLNGTGSSGFDVAIIDTKGVSTDRFTIKAEPHSVSDKKNFIKVE